MVTQFTSLFMECQVFLLGTISNCSKFENKYSVRADHQNPPYMNSS